MKIYSWNVNGIRAVINKGAFQELIKKHNPDILCLQETKAMQGQAVIDLPQYFEAWNSADKKGYSGTAIFSKTKPISTFNNFPEHIAIKYGLANDNYGNPNNEGRILTAEFEHFYIVNVYTPNSKGDLSRLELRKNKWDPAFLDYIQELEKLKPVIFCGDLNVAHTEEDLANPDTNVGKHGFTDDERHGLNNYIDSGYIDTFRIFIKGNGHYTWWTNWANARARNLGWRIDYFLVSAKLKNNVVNADIHDAQMGSDHCPISLDLEFNNT